jgi:Sulfotransferase domain
VQILTVRDTPAQWYKSTADTVGSASIFAAMKAGAEATGDDSKKALVAMGSTIVWDNPDTFAGRMHAGDQAFCEGVYSRWNEECKAFIPAERLLVFNASEGWGPLCKFLGVPEPAEPFPKLWDRNAFKQGVAARAAAADKPAAPSSQK